MILFLWIKQYETYFNLHNNPYSQSFYDYSTGMRKVPPFLLFSSCETFFPCLTFLFFWNIFTFLKHFYFSETFLFFWNIFTFLFSECDGCRIMRRACQNRFFYFNSLHVETDLFLKPRIHPDVKKIWSLMSFRLPAKTFFMPATHLQVEWKARFLLWITK